MPMIGPHSRLEMAQSEISVLGAEHFYPEELKGFAD
jgi:hypothetical protein